MSAVRRPRRTVLAAAAPTAVPHPAAADPRGPRRPDRTDLIDLTEGPHPRVDDRSTVMYPSTAFAEQHARHRWHEASTEARRFRVVRAVRAEGRARRAEQRAHRAATVARRATERARLA